MVCAHFRDLAKKKSFRSSSKRNLYYKSILSIFSITSRLLYQMLHIVVTLIHHIQKRFFIRFERKHHLWNQISVFQLLLQNKIYSNFRCLARKTNWYNKKEVFSAIFAVFVINFSIPKIHKNADSNNSENCTATRSL